MRFNPPKDCCIFKNISWERFFPRDKADNLMNLVFSMVSYPHFFC
jgi:hypothetical protein